MPVKIDAIGHCAIAASDIEAMARFYQEIEDDVIKQTVMKVRGGDKK